MKETGNDRINGQHPIIPNEDGVVGENMVMTGDTITDEIMVELGTGFPTKYRRTFVFPPEGGHIKNVETWAIEGFCPFAYRYLRYTCFAY